MKGAHLAETRQSLGPIHPEHQQRQRQTQQFEGGENFDYYVDRKTGWRYPQAASSSSTSQWSTSQWQTSWSSWQPTSSEKWWWFRFLGKNSRKSTGGVDTTPAHNPHLCSTVCSQARNAHHALGSSNHGLHVIFVRLKRICHMVLHMSHPCWSLPHLPCTTSTSSSSFTLLFLPRHKNTHYVQSGQHDLLHEHPVHHAHLQALPVDKLRHQESLVKTCRVAETRARQLPQVMSPKSLRLSQGSNMILEIHINFMMYRKIRRSRSPSSDHRTSEGIWRNWDSRILKYQRRPTSNRRCISTIPWKALQILISKMESYKRCWLHHCMPRKLRGSPMQWSCRRER